MNRKIRSILFVMLVPGVLYFSCAATEGGTSTYYISAEGNDRAKGTSPESPWRSFERIRAQKLRPGDSVLLRAGDVWRETLVFDASGSPGRFIYFGRYGEGANPKILGSEKVTVWKKAEGLEKVWKAEGNFSNSSYGNGDGRIFIMKDDSVSWGEYRHQLAPSELQNEFEYTVDEAGIHYLYAETDPSLTYDSVEIAQRDRCVWFAPTNSYIEFRGIDVRFATSKGFFAGYPAARGASDLVFRQCSIQYIGRKSGSNDYGITAFHSNLLVEDCYFSDCGRRAISINTYTSLPEGRKIGNIIIRNNEFRRGFHTTALDISVMKQEGDTIQGVYFYNNYLDDSEVLRSDLEAGHRSNQIFIQGGKAGKYLVDDIYIVSNLFVSAQTRWINFSGTMSHHIWQNTFAGHNPAQVKSPYSGIGLGKVDSLEILNNIFVDNLPDNELENNIIHGYNSEETVLKRDYNLYYTLHPGKDRNFTSADINGRHYFYHSGEWKSYRLRFPEHEVHSPQPADPLFRDPEKGDFGIKPGSAARGAGMKLPSLIVKDPFGKEEDISKMSYRSDRMRNADGPSLGAIEYDPDF